MRTGSNKAISALLLDALLTGIRDAVREEIKAGMRNRTPEEPTGKPYLTVKEAAATSGLAASTIRLYIRKRQLRAQRVGQRVIIKRGDLAEFLEANPIEITPDKLCP